MNVVKPIAEGIKESFMLAASIVVAVVTVVSSFAHHSVTFKGANRCASRDSASIEPRTKNA
jgi:hypothetical protein